MSSRAAVVGTSLTLLLAGSTALAAQSKVNTSLKTPSAAVRMVVPPTPPPGPPPQGLDFEALATYGIFARIKWNAAPNAVSYQVTRSRRDDPSCCNAVSAVLPATTTSWTDVGLYWPTYYRYTVSATYADGSVGQQAIDMLVLGGSAPTVKVIDLSPGRVRLEWHHVAVPGTCCIKLIGPGFGSATEKFMVGGGPLELNLPAGNHTWKVAAAYNVKNLPVQPATNYGTASAYGDDYVILAPPSEWATVSHSVNIRSGRFRISLERFEAKSDVTEDLLRADGRGNEIYIATQVNEYGKTGVKSMRMARTPTFGDVQNYPNRVQAGSSSAQGGVRANDVYPAAAEYVSQLVPPTTTNLPYLLWEGELSEVDGVVVLNPSIWEADEDDRLFGQYYTFQTGQAPYLPNKPFLTPFFPGPSGKAPLDTWRPSIGNDCTLSDRFRPMGSWGDEPVDMSRSYPYCPKYVAINWKLADGLTTVNSATVMEIPYFTSSPSGEYKLFVRVERVTGAMGTIAPRSLRRTKP